MSDFSKRLGDSIYQNRKRLKMTQAELAEKAGVTEQTIRKIEHGEGNPQLEVLCSLITTLGIDPSEIIYPRQDSNKQYIKQLEILLSDCTDNQIRDLLPVIKAALEIVKGRNMAGT